MPSLTIDKRKLHVANIYVEYENASPAQIMQQAHDKIRERYLRIAEGKGFQGEGSSAEALELNNFFQAIKLYQRQKDFSFLHDVDKKVIQQIFESAIKIRRSESPTVKYLFQTVSSIGKEQGDAAERDLAIIIQSVFNNVSTNSSNNSNDYKKLILGNEYVNVTNKVLDPKFVDNLAKSMINIGAKKVYTKIMEDKGKTQFSQVQGKIDVSGAMAKIDFDINANDYLLRIGKLLSKAAFSVKSYSSKSFDKEEEKLIDSKISHLHLGHTDQQRIFSDILGQVGIPNKVALNVLYYAKKTKNKNIKQQSSRLMFVYELTGYGQKYVNNAINEILNDLGLNGANYFVFNDPATENIYVKSTAELISELWKKVDKILESGSTNLSKAIFYPNK